MGGYVGMKALPQFGAEAKGERKERIKNAPNFDKGEFQNIENTPVQAEDASMWQTMREFMKNDPSRTPADTLQVVPFSAQEFSTKGDMQFVWFGHSSILLKMSGKTIFFDPVFSGFASPFSFMGPKQFHYSADINIEDFPEIDVVVISHDHYDHLDHKTIKLIKDRTACFIVPLGVGAHLERWGVESSKIAELNWWEEHLIDSLTFACTPSRHFSGRGIGDKNKTLWCSWVLKQDEQSVFYSGDSGYGNHFKEIHEQYGDMDIAFIECGQYNKNWPYIHMMPEQSAKVAGDLNASLAVPVHWGKFKLSLHAWDDPVDRFIAEAGATNQKYYVPKIGEIFGKNAANTAAWWK